MQYNIVSGFWSPKVPKLSPEAIIVIQCCIRDLAEPGMFFFTDGQANTSLSKPFNSLEHIGELDWESIQHGNFGKADGDLDRPRRYQAEFLVRSHVPVTSINALFVFNDKAATFVKEALTNVANETLKLQIEPRCFFH